MIYDYQALNNSITAAIESHLAGLTALPQSLEVPKVASEITQVVFAEFNKYNLTEEALTTVWKTATPRTAAQGRA